MNLEYRLWFEEAKIYFLLNILNNILFQYYILMIIRCSKIIQIVKIFFTKSDIFFLS